jgi:hypothetical protein
VGEGMDCNVFDNLEIITWEELNLIQILVLDIYKDVILIMMSLRVSLEGY